MHVISRKKLLEFAQKYPQATIPLDVWYRTIKSKQYRSLVKLKTDFPSADYVKGKTVFDIGGNKFRLITVIHYNTKQLFIRQALTHEEYNKGDWK